MDRKISLIESLYYTKIEQQKTTLEN